MHTRREKPHYHAKMDVLEALIDAGLLTIRQLEKKTGVAYQHIHQYVVSRKREPRANIAYELSAIAVETRNALSAEQTTAFEKKLKSIQRKKK